MEQDKVIGKNIRQGVQPLLPVGNFLNKRYSIEMDFPDGSNPFENFKYLDEIVTATHMKEFPLCYSKDGKPLFSNYQGEEEQPVKQIKEPEPKLTKEEKQKKCITDTTTIDGADGLKSFALLVKNNPHLQETYDNQLKKLQNVL